MRLREALQAAGVTRWQKAARYYNLSHLEFASSRLYQELMNLFRDPDQFQLIFDDLPQAEHQLLRAIAVTQSLNYLYDHRHWRSYVNYTLSRKPEALVELQNRGLIYLNQLHQYYIPSEILAIIIKIMKERTRETLNTSEVQSYMYSGGEIVIGDIIRFLDALRKRKVRITLANKFYKTDYEKFCQQYGLEQDRFQLNCGTRLDFVYKYTVGSELAFASKGILNITNKGEGFSQTPPQEIWNSILQYWILKYPLDAASRVAATVLLAVVIQLLWPNSTLSAVDLRRLYQANGGLIPVHTETDDWLEKTVNELMYLGVLSCGLHCQEVCLGEKALYLISGEHNQFWMQESSFVTQPNLEILLSSHANPAIHWRLASLCEDEGGNEMYRYRITRHSIYSALLRGWKVDEIIDFIKENSRLGVPENVFQVLSDWGSKFGQLYFMETCLLCCKNSDVVQEILRIPDFAQYVEGLINKSTLVVRRDNYLPLLNELEKKGYMPFRQLFNSSNAPFTSMLKEEQ